MKFVALFLVSIAIFLTACGGSGTADNSANANSAGTNVAEYSDASLALSDGTKLLDSGETDQAIAVLSQAVKLNPDLAEAYFQLGVAYALIEKRDEGAITTNTATNSNDEETKGKEKKANSIIAFERAIEGYKKMIAANKDDFASHFNLGRAYNKLNNDVAAEKAFEKAAELNPEDTEYQMELGSIRIKLAKYHEAIGPLKKSLEIDPDNVEAQEFLEDAEAGRRRVDYKSTPKKDDKQGNSNSANSNSATSPPTSNSSTKQPEPPKPAPTKKPANRP